MVFMREPGKEGSPMFGGGSVDEKGQKARGGGRPRVSKAGGAKGEFVNNGAMLRGGVTPGRIHHHQGIWVV